MIEVKNLVKSFEGTTVLHNINCVFNPGMNNLIIGQSGSGKTVLMKCLIGLVRPDQGEILYNDRNLLKLNTKETRKLREEIGMLFQGSALFDSMTVKENVEFPLVMFSNMTTKEINRRAMFCLERVNLKEAENKFPSEISGGMQKRVAIARAISLNPRYLFCDEPNSGLDPQTSILIDELINDITKEYNITTIVNTHDMNSVLGIGDNIIFLNKGKKEWVGNKDQILTSHNEVLNDFVFASPLFKSVREAAIDINKDLKI
ncbi:MAG: ABC transporter ATP-binding protein [Bacteroidales bacterium]|nr:ABC transporter ATP-binding protein [Bacteroidales bacterium]